MSITMPTFNHAYLCSHCKVKCRFDVQGHIRWNHGDPEEGPVDSYDVCVLSCQNCGQPLIAIVPEQEFFYWDVVYPIGPTRLLAPEELRRTNPSLADDYDDAVKCENVSITAAMLLLGRCLDFMLEKKAGADKDSTLGPKIMHAIDKKAIPPELEESLRLGFLVARNMSGHVWLDENDHPLRITKEMLDEFFLIIDELFEHFYFGPARREARLSELQRIKEQKVK